MWTLQSYGQFVYLHSLLLWKNEWPSFSSIKKSKVKTEIFFLFIFHRSLALLPFLITSLGKRRAYCFLVLLFQMVLSKTMGIARRSEQSRLDSNSNELPQDGVCAHTLLCQLGTLELFFSSFWRPHFFCLLFTYCVAEWKPRSYKKKQEQFE